VQTQDNIFINYSEDEFGYMLFDFIHKKLVRDCGVQFVEYQVIEDINKVEKKLVTRLMVNQFNNLCKIQILIFQLTNDMVLKIGYTFLLMMRRKNMKYHEMKVLVILLNYLKFNSKGIRGETTI